MRSPFLLSNVSFHISWTRLSVATWTPERNFVSPFSYYGSFVEHAFVLESQLEFLFRSQYMFLFLSFIHQCFCFNMFCLSLSSIKVHTEIFYLILVRDHYTIDWGLNAILSFQSGSDVTSLSFAHANFTFCRFLMQPEDQCGYLK